MDQGIPTGAGSDGNVVSFKLEFNAGAKLERKKDSWVHPAICFALILLLR